jgi:hypothetical protein
MEIITPKQVIDLLPTYKWWPLNREGDSNLVGILSFYNGPAMLDINFDGDGTWRMHREDGLGMNYTITDEVDNPTIDDIRKALRKLIAA